MTKVQQRLVVDKEVDNKSPVDAGGQTSKMRKVTYCTIFLDPERDQLTTNKQTVTLYRAVSYYFWSYKKTGVLGLKVLLRRVFWKWTTTFSELQVYLLCISGAKEALGAKSQ